MDTPEIVFALGEEEYRLFFPTPPEGRFPGISLEWRNVRELDRESWDEMLDVASPRILVTGWQTPRLAPGRLAIHGGSIDYVCHIAGTVRHLVTRQILEAGLKISNWGSLVAPQVAEHALLLTLGALRNLPEWHGFMRGPDTTRAKERLAPRTLYGKRVALHGFGFIAREFMRLLRPFNVTLSVFSESVPGEFIRKHGAEPAGSLPELVRGADVFVTCEALTERSRLAINRDVFAALPERAIFVNVGRGALVDEKALLHAMHTRGLRLASDVFTREPLPTKSPFLAQSGALLSPHIAGPTPDVYPDCGERALANIANHLAGRPVTGLVTPEIFDRST
ncbi:phosphoglycerate dehydrogenase-like oxidoreductase [Opitutaceae bacterium TAV1]|nr:phosphoglycerate dehydrogenase-like oxidoreductase [Opitutaceae bacterium TAV1]